MLWIMILKGYDISHIFQTSDTFELSFMFRDGNKCA